MTSPMSPLQLGTPLTVPIQPHSRHYSESVQSTPIGTPTSPSLVPSITATPITQAINAQQQAMLKQMDISDRSVLPVIPESAQALEQVKSKFTLLFKVEEQRRINASLTTMKNLDRGDKITTKTKSGTIQREEPTSWYQYITPEWVRRGLRGDTGVSNSEDVRDLYLEAIRWLDEGIQYQDRLDSMNPVEKIFEHLTQSQLELERKNNRILIVQLLIKIEESLAGFNALIDKTYNKDNKKGSKDAFTEARDEIKNQLERCRRAIARWSIMSA